MSIDLEAQYDKIYRYCYFRLHDRELSEDITQETFLRYFASYHQTDSVFMLKYLYTIAHNLCIDEYRRDGKRKEEQTDQPAYVFPEEHMRRTDQLMLSSVLGKNTVYWAKIWAGVSVSVIATLLMVVLIVALSLGIYGTEGFQAAFQLYPSHNMYPWPLTMGQACLIAYGMVFITAVLSGMFVMVLSELLHSNIATLSVSVGIIIAGMICSIPNQYRVLAQIWNWLPMTFLDSWSVFDIRLLTVFGHSFVSWQAIPVFYILSSIGLAVFGKHFYKGYQVSGR